MSKGGTPKVSIGYCHPDKVSSFFMASLINLLRRHHHQIKDVIGVLSGPKIDTARNQIVREFLKGDADYLLMVDTDMVLPRETIHRLLAADKDIVGGLCFTGSFTGSNVAPAIRVAVDTPEGTALTPLWDYPRDEIIPVIATGAACIMVHKRVFKDILAARGENHIMPWFAHGAHNGIEIGEDIAFCLTAAKVGYETWVDTGLVVDHVKPRFIGEHAYVEALNRDSHPYYDDRESVPIYQELLNDHSSLHGNTEGNQKLQVS